jgi:hypothetical protein
MAMTSLTYCAAALALLAVPHLAASQQRGESMEQRLQRLEDREAIAELLITYGQMLDRQDLAGYSGLFAAKGIWEGGIGSAEGPQAIHAMLETVFGRTTAEQYDGSYHIMSDIKIDVTGDTATSWSRWTWLVEGPEGKPMPQRSGHYEDRLVRENGEWRFAYRLTVTELPTAARDTEAAIWRKDHRSRE